MVNRKCGPSDFFGKEGLPEEGVCFSGRWVRQESGVLGVIVQSSEDHCDWLAWEMTGLICDGSQCVAGQSSDAQCFMVAIAQCLEPGL